MAGQPGEPARESLTRAMLRSKCRPPRVPVTRRELDPTRTEPAAAAEPLMRIVAGSRRPCLTVKAPERRTPETNERSWSTAEWAERRA